MSHSKRPAKEQDRRQRAQENNTILAQECREGRIQWPPGFRILNSKISIIDPDDINIEEGIVGNKDVKRP